LAPAMKVIVFQWPCGTAATRRWPRRHLPRRRAILVLAPVSSMKTSRVGSSAGCRARHTRRFSATSGRSCSAACAVFFEADGVTMEEVPQSSNTALDAPFRAQPGNDLFKREVWRLVDLRQQPVRMRVKLRAPGRAHRSRLNAARLPPAPGVTDRRTDADVIVLRSLAPRNPAINRIHYPLPEIFRVGPAHRKLPLRFNNKENQNKLIKRIPFLNHTAMKLL